MKCIECGDTASIRGYCFQCAAQRLGEYAILKKNLDTAIEPVRSWYGEIERPAVDVVANAITNLQKYRTQLHVLGRKVEELSKAELRRVTELHTVYTEKSDLNAVLQRALKDVAVFEDLANKAETARVIRLETCLREIAKSPNWRGVPNWVVLKIQEVVGC